MEDNVDSIIAKYGQPTPKKSKKRRIVLIIVLVLLVAVIIAAGGSLLFKNKPAAAPTVAPAAQTAVGPHPKEVIDKIAANETIARSENDILYRLDESPAGSSSDVSTVIFKEDGYTFLTNTNADDGLQFIQANTKLASNKAAVTGAIQEVLKSAGFKQIDQDTASLTAYGTTSYINDGTICQIIDLVNNKQATLEQAVNCISQDTLKASYANVKTLLAMAGPSIASSAKTVSQSTITDGTKKLLTLTVLPNGSDATTNYYFATLDKDYEYIGARTTPSVDNEASYTIPAQLKKNMSDPKWGTFLTDTIK